MTSPTQEQWRWTVSDDTGISSRGIWSVMTGERLEGIGNPPWDPDDFGRCYRLLKRFPEWRARLGEVSDAFPIWAGLVEVWDELEALYEEERPKGYAPKLYERMRELTRGES